jgi:hypothetical protein
MTRYSTILHALYADVSGTVVVRAPLGFPFSSHMYASKMPKKKRGIYWKE